MAELIRTQTPEEKADFIDIYGKDRTSAKAKFEEAMAKAQQEAIKKGLPFADRVCRDEFMDYYKNEVDKSLKKHGYLETSEIKPLKVDFKKYSDLKNFEVIETGEIHDEYLSKKNPGVNISVKWTKYKYEGYMNEYVVMEDPADAVKRALKVHSDAKERAK